MTEEALVLRDEPLSVAEIKAQVQLIQQVMKSVMKEGTHYGTIPGCGNKPVLLKPGAETLNATFRMAPDPHINDMSTDDEIRYQVTVRLGSSSRGFLGAGIGECSSNEEKYKWRKVVCDGEWEEAMDDTKREKWYRDGNKTKQIRTNMADVANTVLKMAKKRALVDAVLTVTAASDIFTQDIEDMPPEVINGGRAQLKGKPDVKRPQSKSANKDTPPATDAGEDEDIRNKISKMLLELVDGPDQIPEMIEQYSAFEGKNGDTVCRDALSKLSGKWLKSTYGKIKKDYETAGFGQDHSQIDDTEREPGEEG